MVGLLYNFSLAESQVSLVTHRGQLLGRVTEGLHVACHKQNSNLHIFCSKTKPTISQMQGRDPLWKNLISQASVEIVRFQEICDCKPIIMRNTKNLIEGSSILIGWALTFIVFLYIYSSGVWIIGLEGGSWRSVIVLVFCLHTLFNTKSQALLSTPCPCVMVWKGMGRRKWTRDRTDLWRL